MPPVKKAFIPLVLLVIALFYFIKKCSSHSEAPINSAASDNGQGAKTTILAPGATSVPEIPPAHLAEAKKDFMKTIVLGLKPILVAEQGGHLNFHVKPLVEGSGCQIGDFDQIKSLPLKPADKAFLLTVEPLDAGGKLQRGVYSLNRLVEGIPISVSVPPAKNVDFYGIFLCSARKSSKNCGDKPEMTKKEWAAVAHGKLILDRLLHAQLIAVKKNEAFLFPSDEWDNAHLVALQKQLGINESKPVSALAAWNRHQAVLRSLGATLMGSTVALSLPYRGTQCTR